MSLQYLVHFIQQEFLEIIYYNTRVHSTIIKQQNENKHLAETIQGFVCVHQKNPPHKSYSLSLHNVLTRLTQLVGIISRLSRI